MENTGLRTFPDYEEGMIPVGDGQYTTVADWNEFVDSLLADMADGSIWPDSYRDVA